MEILFGHRFTKGGHCHDLIKGLLEGKVFISLLKGKLKNLFIFMVSVPLLARTFAFCPLQVSAHSPFSISIPCLAQAASGSAPSAAAAFSPIVFPLARVPLHWPSFPTAPPRGIPGFPPVNSRDSSPWPREASPLHAFPRVTGLLQTFGVPELRITPSAASGELEACPEDRD